MWTMQTKKFIPFDYFLILNRLRRCFGPLKLFFFFLLDSTWVKKLTAFFNKSGNDWLNCQALKKQSNRCHILITISPNQMASSNRYFTRKTQLFSSHKFSYLYLSPNCSCYMYRPPQGLNISNIYIYSYFEKGSRKKCTRPSRKV